MSGSRPRALIREDLEGRASVNPLRKELNLPTGLSRTKAILQSEPRGQYRKIIRALARPRHTSARDFVGQWGTWVGCN